MRNQIIADVEKSSMKAEVPEFRIGDTVDVAIRIVEGDKTRTQVFSGTVIMRKGQGVTEMVTVRRIVNNEGVERIFPLHSPNVQSITVKRSGETRRAKLYFLRDRVGKAVRLVEKRRTPTKAAKAAEGGAATEEPALAGA